MIEYEIDEYFEFHFNTQTPATGAAVDADALPTWRCYEENNDTVEDNGNCAKRDDANTTGYYIARGQCTAALGYEVGKKYIVRVVATVGAVGGATPVGMFEIVPADVVRDDTWTDAKAVFVDVSIASRAPEAGGNIAAILDDTGTSGVISVTGAVGSVAGNVGGNVVGTVASVVGNVGGNVTGSVGSVAAGGIVAASFGAGALDANALNADAVDEIVADILATPANLIVTNAAGEVVSSSVQGNVTGSVASVVGAVGSVAGNVDGSVSGNVTGTVGSVIGAVGSVAGNVDGNISGNVVGTVGSVVGAVGSVAGNVDGNVSGNVVGTVASVTGNVDGNVGGNVVGTVASVTGAVGSVGAGGIVAATFGASAIDANAVATSAVDEVVDQVWDELIAGHLVAGSTGEALNSAGALGDPWITGLPGAYVDGTAGAIVGNLLADIIAAVGTGSGANTVAVTMNDDSGIAVASVGGTVRSDPGGALVAVLLTDENGLATFALDDGDYLAYYGPRGGYRFSNPYSLTVAGDTVETFTCIALTVPAAVAPELCACWIDIYYAVGALAGTLVGANEGSVEVASISPHWSTDEAIPVLARGDTKPIFQTNAAGRASFDAVRGAELRLKVTRPGAIGTITITVPDQASYYIPLGGVER